MLVGGAGDDRLSGGMGDDRLVGGEGTDTAVFSGQRSDYDISLSDNGRVTVVDSRGIDGSDQLVNVERIRFSDGTVTVDSLADVQQTSSTDEVSSGTDPATPLDAHLAGMPELAAVAHQESDGLTGEPQESLPVQAMPQVQGGAGRGLARTTRGHR